MEEHKRFIDCQLIGGPKDGSEIRWFMDDPSFIEYPVLWRANSVYLYLLTGNLDDGYRFVYDGIRSKA